MRLAGLLIGIIAVAATGGCGTTDYTHYREDPRAFSNPALLKCATRRVPICNVNRGRTRKDYSNCACRTVSSGPG